MSRDEREAPAEASMDDDNDEVRESDKAEGAPAKAASADEADEVDALAEETDVPEDETDVPEDSADETDALADETDAPEAEAPAEGADSAEETDVPEADAPSESEGAGEARTDEPVDDALRGRADPMPSGRRPRWMIAAQLLLAPLLAGGAVGVHWWLNVPDEIIESPRDQGAKNKNKKNKRRNTRNKDRRRGEKTRDQARSPEQLESDWERFKEVPFEDEPIRAIWARRHQALINRAVVVARHQAFEGAPEQPRVVLTDTKCRSVRCRFTLRSPYHHELEVLSDSLSHLQSNDEDVWRSYEMVPVDPSAEDEDEQLRIQITVAFQTDDTDTRGLAIPKPEAKGSPTADAADASAGATAEAEVAAPAVAATSPT